MITVDGTGDGICHAFATVGPDHQIVRHTSRRSISRSPRCTGTSPTSSASVQPPRGEDHRPRGLRRQQQDDRRSSVSSWASTGAARASLPACPEAGSAQGSCGALLGGHSREDVAAGVQRAVEEVMTGLVTAAFRRYPRRYLCLAGGLFCNVRLNQVLREIPGVKTCTSTRGMADTGQGLGAALGRWAELRERPVPVPLRNVYLGPQLLGCRDRGRAPRTRSRLSALRERPCRDGGAAGAESHRGALRGPHGVRAALARPSQHPLRHVRQDRERLAEPAARPHRVHAVRPVR